MSKKASKDSPFGALQGLRERLVEQEKGKAELLRKARLEQQKKAAEAAAVEDENEMLARAMAGVKPIGPGGTTTKKKPLPAAAKQAAGATESDHKAERATTSRASHSTDDAEVLARLQDLVNERAPLEFTESDFTQDYDWTRHRLQAEIYKTAFSVDESRKYEVKTDPEVMQAVDAMPKAQALLSSAHKIIVERMRK